jgi:hypothetical protein
MSFGSVEGGSVGVYMVRYGMWFIVGICVMRVVLMGGCCYVCWCDIIFIVWFFEVWV